MNAHTPGPWKADDEFIVAPDKTNKYPDVYIAEIVTSDDTGRYIKRANERNANARLIEQAPDMAEALRDCAGELENLLYYLDKDDDPALCASVLARAEFARIILAAVDGAE